ncbi:hypothetical protein ABK040_013295 [Willaertia magna]
MNKQIFEHLKHKINNYLEQHEFNNAIFLADKLYHLTFHENIWTSSQQERHYSEDEEEVIFLLAQAYFGSCQYKRALNLLTNSFTDNFVLTSPIKCFFLAAKCLEKCEEWYQCLSLLGETDDDFEKVIHRTVTKENLSSLYFLRAKAFDKIDNKIRAIHWYRETLVLDPTYFSAFEALIEGNLLNGEEQRNLINEIPFDESNIWVKFIYETKIDNFNFQDNNCKDAFRKLQLEYNLGKNHDVMCSLAEKHFYAQRYTQAYELTKFIIEDDPYNQNCLPIHISTLVELNKKSELFELSHKLVEAYKDSPISWYSVGCYYYCIKKYASARSYFTKSTALNAQFLQAWMGIGHCFSNENEPDQAMAAYRTAYRLFTGSHLPPLYIGIEHTKTNNLTLALQFIEQALNLCNTDPLVYNEMGVIYYQWKLYDKALEYFEEGFKLCPKKDELSSVIKVSEITNNNNSTDSDFSSLVTQIWEPILFNLANTCRKLKQYDRAISLYEKCLSYQPKSAAIHSALGFTYHLQQYLASNNLHKAIEYYHKALALQPDHSFTSTMLSKALIQISNQPLEFLFQEDIIEEDLSTTDNANLKINNKYI